MDGSFAADQWIEVGRLDDVPMRGARVVRLGGLELGVFRTASGQVFALDNKCPHKAGPLSEGIVHDTAVTCPLHNWVIDLASGQARGADEGCVKVYPIEIRADRLFVKLSD